MLTPAAVKAAQPQGRAYKLHDAGGLFLFVAPSGLKSWRFKFRRHGREQLLVLGRFPDLGLPAARAARDEARERLRVGDQFVGADEMLDSFEQIARAWHADQLGRWSKAHAADVLASFERDVFPALGSLPIGTVTAPELLNVVRSVEARGCVATARRLRQRLSAVFGYAIALGKAESDPAQHLGRAMRGAGLVRQHPALTSIDDCRALLEACDQAARSRRTGLAMRFLALTAVRLDAVRGARWDEFEDLDGAEPLWRVPPARMKLARVKKDQDKFAHLVPLCPQAVRLLAEVADLHAAGAGWPGNGLVFAPAGASSPFGENALRELIGRTRFAGAHVPHGWRASFSTILSETLGPAWDADIDRALAHAAKGKVEAAYNRAAQLARRRELYVRWGAMLSNTLPVTQESAARRGDQRHKR